jgi:hypothetical protein
MMERRGADATVRRDAELTAPPSLPARSEQS